MHHVVMMQLQRGGTLVEAQPQQVDQIYFIGGKVGRVGTEDLVDFVAIRQMNFQVELRLKIAQLFPRIADMAGLLFRGLLRLMSEHDSAGLQAAGRTEDAVPYFVRGDNRKSNALASLLCHG